MSFHFTKMNIAAIFVLLCQRIAFFVQVLSVSLDILYHQIFPGQFNMIWKMADHPKKKSFQILSVTYVKIIIDKHLDSV